VTDTSIIYITNALKILFNIEFFHLNLEGNLITDIGAITIGETFKVLGRAILFEINLKGNNITNRGAIQIIHGLKNLSSFTKELILSFSNNLLNDKS